MTSLPGSLTISAGTVIPSNLVLSAPHSCAEVDIDGDGYSAEGSICGGSADDCNDNDSSINSGALEIYSDGIDQNCDGHDVISPVDEDCGNCHGDYIVNMRHITTPDDTCEACHSGRVDNFLSGHYGQTVRTAGNNMIAGMLISCTSCHDWHDEEYTGFAIDGANIVWAKINAVYPNETCDTCHETRAEVHAIDSAHQHRLIDGLCGNCHTSDTTVLGQPGSGTLETGADVYALHRSSCLTCHVYQGTLIDPINNFIYVTGYTGGSLPGYIFQGSRDIVLAKLDMSLNMVWAKQISIGALSYEYGHSIDVDASGNLYVGGQLGSSGCIFYKYDPDGNELWDTTWTASCQQVSSVVVDGSEIYVGGQFDDNAFVKQFDTAGNEGWFAQAGTSGQEKDINIAVTTNYIYVSGSTSGSFPGFISNGGDDLFFLKLNKSDGLHVLTNQIGGSGSQYSGGLVADSTGSRVYAAGKTWNDFFAPTDGRLNAYLLSLDTDLKVLRKKQFLEDNIYNNGIEDLELSPLDDGIYTMGDHNTVFFHFMKEVECSDSDVDGDGLDDAIDNCPVVSNPDQDDNDNDGIGNICDARPDDPVSVVCDDLDNDADGYTETKVIVMTLLTVFTPVQQKYVKTV